jgi:5-bromo-4-chloroindolyl phosphate hydrolysis protein
MSLPQATRDAITKDIEAKFDFLFKQLNNVNKRELVDKYVTLKRVIVRKRTEGKEVVHDGEGAD